MFARWAKGQKRPTVASVISISYNMRQEVQFERRGRTDVKVITALLRGVFTIRSNDAMPTIRGTRLMDWRCRGAHCQWGCISIPSCKNTILIGRVTGSPVPWDPRCIPILTVYDASMRAGH